MKVLLAFIDMVRMDLMHLYDNQKPSTHLDELLSRLGGTLYTNCYTIAPDTPRSLATLQSGLFPSENGCDVRIKWPKDYLKVPSIYDILSSHNTTVRYFAPASTFRTGPFAVHENDHFHGYESLDEFKRDILSSDGDELDYLTINDCHWYLDDYGAVLRNTIRGKNSAAKVISDLLGIHNADQFDHIFIFSDHGHSLENESIAQTSKLQLLADHRIKILMFHHAKTDVANNIKNDTRLCTNLDFFGTLLSLFGIDEDHRRSLNLLGDASTNAHHYLIVEDHDTFSVSLSQIISQWRYISPSGSFYTNIYTSFAEGTPAHSPEAIEQLIAEQCPSYSDSRKQIDILRRYSQIKVSDTIPYTTGIPRRNQTAVKLQKFFYATRRTIAHRIYTLFHK